jgi:hypothetical protein
MDLAKQDRLFDEYLPIKETYLMHGNTVLMTRVNTARKTECYILEMTLSETNIKNDTQRLRYIGMNR